jgi:prepilin-type N-terminal cleavage/methylation domain-containing protein
MKMHKTNTMHDRRPHGFTLIELLFAMTAFSIMLVVAVSGFLNAMWIYNQATVSRDNQQQVRFIIDSIGRSVRTASFVFTPTLGALCLEGTTQGNTYYYTKDIDPSAAVTKNHLFVKQVQGCDPAETPTYLKDVLPVQEKDLLTGGTSVQLQPSFVGTGFYAVAYEQPVVPPATISVQSVRISVGLVRGETSSPRQRQFNNSFEMSSTFLVRNGGV